MSYWLTDQHNLEIFYWCASVSRPSDLIYLKYVNQGVYKARSLQGLVNSLCQSRMRPPVSSIYSAFELLISNINGSISEASEPLQLQDQLLQYINWCVMYHTFVLNLSLCRDVHTASMCSWCGECKVRHQVECFQLPHNAFHPHPALLQSSSPDCVCNVPYREVSMQEHPA